MMTLLKGYLTYTLAAIAFVGALAGWALGLLDQDTAIAMIWGALALFGIRRAIS